MPVFKHSYIRYLRSELRNFRAYRGYNQTEKNTKITSNTLYTSICVHLQINDINGLQQEIKEFSKLYGFNRVTCQCPVGQNSLRKQTEHLISTLEETFPNIRENLSQASFTYASDKALKKR